MGSPCAHVCVMSAVGHMFRILGVDSFHRLSLWCPVGTSLEDAGGCSMVRPRRAWAWLCGISFNSHMTQRDQRGPLVGRASHWIWQCLTGEVGRKGLLGGQRSCVLRMAGQGSPTRPQGSVHPSSQS